MQTSVAVFLAFTVIYFGTVVLPFDVATQAVGWTAQATAVAAAVATFTVMKSRKFSLGPAALLLLCMTVVSILAATAIVLCVQRKQCQQSLPVHSLVFSTGFMSGMAAYVGFLIASAVGLPMWATIVIAVMCAPVYIAYVMPFLANFIANLFNRTE